MSGPDVCAPLGEYLMPRDAEIALAKTAAPASISSRATIKVLTKSGYAQFRSLVHDPAVRAPICFAPPAVRSAMPYYELRTKLAMAGKTPDQIAEGVQAAYVKASSRSGTR
jgi:hypothetical protein